MQRMEDVLCAADLKKSAVTSLHYCRSKWENARFSPVYSEPVLGCYNHVEMGCLAQVSDRLDVSAFKVT